nr:Putrescine oxidase [Paraburkholderia busanensis]
MNTAQIVIIGGGLSGLYAAMLLERQRIDYVLLEARDTFGGRIVSTPPYAGTCTGSDLDRFDLGATWFWPTLQPQLSRLIDELGLGTFEQPETGDMLIERSAHEMPTLVRGYPSSPAAMRIAGGMGALVDAVRRQLDPARVLAGRRVTQLTHSGPHVDVHTLDETGTPASYRASHVLLAMPPRLAASTLTFSPPLPEAMTREWTSTGTWMAPHAKYVAIYSEPFWRGDGLSGEARSAAGPLAEIHDASAPRGHAALFGFLGIPAHVRDRIPDNSLRAHCRAQLVRLFGASAAEPVTELLKDWAKDPLTATAADRTGADHPIAPHPMPADGAWAGRLIAIASEWSPRYAGYAAGALDAASLGVTTLLQRLDKAR